MDSAELIASLDHLVLTVASIEGSVAFYTQVLGMEEVRFGEGRRALRFGSQKLNLHAAGAEFVPHAAAPTPGSADLCFLCSVPLEQVIERLRAHDVPIAEGPVLRTGATSAIRSVYIRDPDGNLIELSETV